MHSLKWWFFTAYWSRWPNTSVFSDSETAVVMQWLIMCLNLLRILTTPTERVCLNCSVLNDIICEMAQLLKQHNVTSEFSNVGFPSQVFVAYFTVTQLMPLLALCLLLLTPFSFAVADSMVKLLFHICMEWWPGWVAWISNGMVHRQAVMQYLLDLMWQIK